MQCRGYLTTQKPPQGESAFEPCLLAQVSSSKQPLPLPLQASTENILTSFQKNGALSLLALRTQGSPPLAHFKYSSQSGRLSRLFPAWLSRRPASLLTICMRSCQNISSSLTFFVSDEKKKKRKRCNN